MIEALEKFKAANYRFRGLELTKSLFPAEYARLNPKLILNDDALEEIDTRLIELIGEHYFPCYDPLYDYINKTRERSYSGLKTIGIEAMGFYAYDYYYNDGASLYFISLATDEYFGYYGYEYNALSYLDWEMQALAHYHPLQILPDAIRYVWAMTGNIWLDTHPDNEDEYDLSAVQILDLADDYIEAVAWIRRLQWFDCWFRDNVAIATTAVNKIVQSTIAYDLRTN